MNKCLCITLKQFSICCGYMLGKQPNLAKHRKNLLKYYLLVKENSTNSVIKSNISENQTLLRIYTQQIFFYVLTNISCS